jgi:hypothetical protein
MEHKCCNQALARFDLWSIECSADIVAIDLQPAQVLPANSRLSVDTLTFEGFPSLRCSTAKTSHTALEFMNRSRGLKETLSIVETSPSAAGSGNVLALVVSDSSAPRTARQTPSPARGFTDYWVSSITSFSSQLMVIDTNMEDQAMLSLRYLGAKGTSMLDRFPALLPRNQK